MDEPSRRPASAGAGLAGLLAVALAGILAGCEAIRITGGTSEVGNPVSAFNHRDADDSTAAPVTGIGISAKGAPIRLLRAGGEPEKASAAAPPTRDSLPVP